MPRECTLDKQVFDYQCCPTTESGVCGGPTRGSCEDITNNTLDPCQNSTDNVESRYCRTQEFLRSRPGVNSTDFRYRWPTQIFQRVCVCKGNYDDYNCMRCKRGYTGENCSQPLASVLRRNILSLSEAEQGRFLEITQMIKSAQASGYTVPIREPVTTVPRDSFIEISLFDVFATFHFTTIRDETINKCPNDSFTYRFCNKKNECPIPNFAHEGPAFLTWHRAYMLYVETEIQRMINDPTFALPYWDWLDETTRNQIWDLMGKSNCGMFPPNPSINETIDGPFSNWSTVCTNSQDLVCNGGNQVCNPTENLGKIQRCIGGTEGVQCRVESMLPSIRELNVALKEQLYDTPPYNISKDLNGFRNALEGFKELVERNVNVCENFSITELHNRVHIYVGGTMLEVPTASNDPIFFLHHCNVDRLYEEWLDQYSDANFPSYQPDTFNYGIAPGHNIDEYLVPMFPLMTNREIHRRAASLGYTYKEMPSQGSGCVEKSQLVCS